MTRLFFLAFFLTINFFRRLLARSGSPFSGRQRLWGNLEAAEFPRNDSIIVDIKSGPARPDTTDRALYNLVRPMNLHGLGGVDKENMKVATVGHAEVILFICRQSLQAMSISKEELSEEVNINLSALPMLTTYRKVTF